MIARHLVLSIAAHALVAAHRSACAVVETAGVAWDHLTAPAPLAGGDPLDDGRFAQAPGANWMRAHQRQLARLGEVVAELQAARESLDEMRAQRDQAESDVARLRSDLAEMASRRSSLASEARFHERAAAEHLAHLHSLLAVIFRDAIVRTATFPTLADAVVEASRIVAEGRAARDILGARAGETLVEAAERVTAERKRLEQWARIPSEPDHA